MTGRSSQTSVTFDHEGVRLCDPSPEAMQWYIRWSEVTEIAVWRDDVFAYDIICMGFGWLDSEGYKRVDEEMKGWSELIAEVERRFGITAEMWMQEVAAPAFATNMRVIWKQTTR